ncbi:MAG: hypothetical protein AABX70_07005 [Nanoarchaeota archaeon]
MRDIWKAERGCECGTWMKKKLFTLAGIKVRGWECPKCSESILHPEDAQYALVLNKLKRGIPVKIGELGNSLFFRIPKEIVDFYKIKKGGKLVLKGGKKKMEIDV